MRSTPHAVFLNIAMTESTRITSAMTDDPRLKAYFQNNEERKALTNQMFDQTADDYDRAEALTGLGSGPWYRKEVLIKNGLGPGMHVLDVAAGTGLVSQAAVELVGPKGRLIALDPSPGMLTALRKKLNVETLEAFAEDIPLPSDHVDFISMGYALRHVGDMPAAFGEFRRVLKLGGRVCIMEISRPKSRVAQILLRGYIGTIVPFLARFMRNHKNIKTLWQYYSETIQAAVAPELILDTLKAAGFTNVECSCTFGIFREYTGNKPA